MGTLGTYARFTARKTTQQTITGRTSETINWDTVVVNEPAGWFSDTISSTSELSTSTGNEVTINVPGIYLVTANMQFDIPAGTSEFLALWLYRNNGGVLTLDKFLYGGKGAEGGETRFDGAVLIKVTQADINNGDNKIKVLCYYAEVVDVNGTGGDSACWWDILFLDKV